MPAECPAVTSERSIFALATIDFIRFLAYCILGCEAERGEEKNERPGYGVVEAFHLARSI